MNDNKTKKKSLWTPIFIVAMLIDTFSSLSSYMTNPIMADYLLYKGVSFELTGILSSLISWVSMLFRPISGWMSDNYNKKKIMILSHGVTFICMIMYTIAPSASFIVPIRIIHGIAFGFTATLSITFATTFIEKDVIAEGLAYLSLGAFVASMFGPQLGSWIASIASISVAFLVAGSLSLIAFILILFLPYKYMEIEKTKLHISLNEIICPKIIPYMVIICLFTLGKSVITYYLNNFGTERAIANVSLYFTVNSLALILTQPLFSKIHDSKGMAYVMYPSFVFAIVSLCVLARSYSLFGVLIAAILNAVGQGTASSALQADSVKIAGEKDSGVAITTCLVGMDIGYAIGPVIGSNLIATVGYTATFGIFALLVVVGMLCFYIFYHLKYKHKKLEMKGEFVYENDDSSR